MPKWLLTAAAILSLVFATGAAILIVVFTIARPSPATLVVSTPASISKIKEVADGLAIPGPNRKQPRPDLKQLRSAAGRLTKLSAAGKGISDGDKKELVSISKIITLAATEQEAVWKGIDDKVSELKAASESLSKLVPEVVDAAKKAQAEADHLGESKASAILSYCLWFTIFCAVLAVVPRLASMITFILRLIRGVKLPGLELTFTEKDAEKNMEIHAWFSEAFSMLRDQAKRVMRLFVDQQGIKDEFRYAVNRILDEFRNNQSPVQGAGQPDATKLSRVRCTVHVPDLVFDDYLCQLVDYYPRPSAGRAGRAWPVCYGMIGRVWRSRKSELRSLGPGGNDAALHDTLVDEYAMTDEQVKELVGVGRSFLCLILRTNLGIPVGILYMDTDEAGAFGTNQNSPHSSVREPGANFTALLAHCGRLIEKLSALREKLSSPRIDVNDPQ